MTFNDIVFQMFRRVIWMLLRGFLGPLGGLPGASWRPLGGLLGASWGPLGGLLGVLEVELKLNIILEGLNFAEGPSWSRLGVDFWVFWGHFGVPFEAFSSTVVTANWTCKIDDLLAFWPLWLEFSWFLDALKHCKVQRFWLLEAISTAYLQWNRKIDEKNVFEKVVVTEFVLWWSPRPLERPQKTDDGLWPSGGGSNFGGPGPP